MDEPRRASERPCRDCVWHSEDGCFVWDCDPITRQELADARRIAAEVDDLVGMALLRSFAKESLRIAPVNTDLPLYKRLRGEMD